tara:strand:- start:182 stop:1417 length:1236 start_codon:yes stop_codon:yes gene_type:complete
MSNFDDFTLDTSLFDTTGVSDNILALETQIEQLDLKQAIESTPSLVYRNMDYLFIQIIKFETDMAETMVNERFWGLPLRAAWGDYISARDEVIFYRAKKGIPSKGQQTNPDLSKFEKRLIGCQRMDYACNILPREDRPQIAFKGHTVEWLREIFFDGYEEFADDLHKIKFAHMCACMRHVIPLTNMKEPIQWNFGWKNSTIHVFGCEDAIEPRELSTVNSAPAHIYNQLAPLTRMVWYKPNRCDFCEVPSNQLYMDLTCAEHCRFNYEKHANSLIKGTPEYLLPCDELPPMERPHSYCLACFIDFCQIQGTHVSECALCQYNSLTNTNTYPRERTDWHYGVQRGWIKNRYETLTGIPGPYYVSSAASASPKPESKDPHADVAIAIAIMDEVSPKPKRFRKCYACDHEEEAL